MADVTGVVHHINLSVSDLDRSETWYRELFGLTELARMTAEDGAWSKVILRHSSGLLVGLTQHERNDAKQFDEWRCGTDHVALAVADVEALQQWSARLDQLGVEHSPVKSTPIGSLITIRDPDNIQLELYSPNPDRSRPIG